MIVGSVLLFLDKTIPNHGVGLWAFIAGVAVFLEVNRMRRRRIRNPSTPPTAMDRLAKVVLNFYEPAAPFVFVVLITVLVVGTVAILYLARWFLTHFVM